MSYIINKSDGTPLATIEEGTINSSACSIALVGRRTASYGQPIAENFVHLLENHASSTAPTAPLIGQLWFDKGTTALKLYNGAAWVIVASFSVNGSVLTGYQLVLTCPDGVTPITTNSKTKVANLNADYLDGYDSSIPVVASTVVVRNGNGDILANNFLGRASSTTYADIAERFEASESLEPGDVVTIGGAKEIRKAGPTDDVLGVISTNPGVLMNKDAGDDISHPAVGYLGRIPVKVSGRVAKGQRLAVSGNGIAVAQNMNWFGRALEDKFTDDVGLVLAVIGVR